MPQTLFSKQTVNGIINYQLLKPLFRMIYALKILKGTI